MWASHAMTVIAWRAYEFAVPLLLAQLSPGSLFIPAAFGLCEALVAATAGSAVGRAVDRAAGSAQPGARVTLLRRAILLLKLFTCSGLASVYIMPYARDWAGPAAWTSTAQSAMAMAVRAVLWIGIFGSGGCTRIAAMVVNIGVEKDWYVCAASASKQLAD